MSTLAVNAVTDANGGNTATINSMTPTADSLQGFRNRIINGDCRIAQRTTGAVTVNTSSSAYPVDRFAGRGVTSAGVFTAQQSSTAPSGFTNSVVCTVTTAESPLVSTNAYRFVQHIEGFNVADLGWGTANAKTVTLSFKVRSSLTGTFGGAIQNGDFNRFYPFSYTITSANTWTDVSIVIPGDTSGTWQTNNSLAIRLSFSLGAGSSRVNTAGSWTASTTEGATGQVNLIETNGATWYITGVQLEVGSVATPFERRPYGTELVLCQRYYEKSYNDGVAPATATAVGTASGQTNVSNISTISIRFKVDKRATPTVTIYGTDGTAGVVTDNVNRAGTPTNTGATGTSIFWGGNTAFIGYVHYTAASEI